MRTNHNTKSRSITAGVFATVLALLLLRPVTAFAGTRQDAAEIENGTLIIGTHLIYLTSATDQLYTLAVQSGIDNQQNSIYYKSEFAGGAWLDITRAQTIFQLSLEEGAAVDNSIINALVLTHHTKSDGKTYALSNGNAVNLFDLNSPYNAAEAGALEGASMMRDALAEGEKLSKTEQNKLDILNRILKGDYHSDETKAIEQELEALGNYLRYLQEKGASKDELDAVHLLMEKQISRRQAAVCTLQKTAVEDGIATASKSTEDRESLTDVIDVLAGALVDLEKTIQDALATQLAEGDTIKSKRYFKEATALLEKAGAGDFGGADGSLAVLVDIGSIENKQTPRQEREKTLAQSLKETLYTSYGETLSIAGTPAMEQALSANSTAQQNAAGKEVLSIAETIRMELQEMIEALILRSTGEDKLSLLDKELEQANAMKPKVSVGALGQVQEQSLKSYIAYLEKRRLEVQSALGEMTEAGKRQQELTALETQYLTALDQNDLLLATKLAGQIDANKQAQQALSTRTNNELAKAKTKYDELETALAAAKESGNNGDEAMLQVEKSALEKEISDLQRALPENDKKALATMNSARDSALTQIQSGGQDKERLLGDISGILQLNQQYPVETNRLLEELYTAINRQIGTVGKTSGLNEALLLLEKNLQESRQNAERVLQGNLDTTALEQAISDAPASVATAALSKLWQETGDGGVEALLYQQMNTLDKGGSLADRELRNGGYYIPIDSLASLTGMRAVVQKDRYVLSKGPQYYQLEEGSTLVRTAAGDEFMPKPAIKRLGRLYIPVEYAEQKFALASYLLPGSQILLIEAAKAEEANTLYASMKSVF